MTRTVRIVVGDGKLARLVRDARRADGLQAPAPLPGQRASATVATVAPHDDPDPERREAARGRIAREAA